MLSSSTWAWSTWRTMVFKDGRQKTTYWYNYENRVIVIVSFTFFTFINLSAFTNKKELLNKVLDLKNTITSCVRRICVVMRFLLMQEEFEYPTLKDVRHRRDVVFSQAVSYIFLFFFYLFIVVWMFTIFSFNELRSMRVILSFWETRVKVIVCSDWQCLAGNRTRGPFDSKINAVINHSDMDPQLLRNISCLYQRVWDWCFGINLTIMSIENRHTLISI